MYYVFALSLKVGLSELLAYARPLRLEGLCKVGGSVWVYAVPNTAFHSITGTGA